MSYTDNVANFLDSLDNFYENVPVEDLEMLVGPVIEKMRSRPNSPLSGSPLASRDTSPSRVAGAASRDTSPVRLPNKHITVSGSLETSPASSYSASPLPPDTDDDDDEHFLDTQTEPDKRQDAGSKKNQGRKGVLTEELQRPIIITSFPIKGMSGVCPESCPLHSFPSINADLARLNNRLDTVEQTNPVTCSKIGFVNGGRSISRNENSTAGISILTSETYKRAVDNLMKDMEQMQLRMTALENIRQQESRLGGGQWRWWGLPLHTTAALLAWPFLILLISKWLSNRRQR